MRIIDFMSGVCYGIEGQGHAMKLGETIFLFTPNDFEISSDETDYGENQEFFFKDIPAIPSAPAVTSDDLQVPGLQSGTAPASYHSVPPPDRRSWER